MSHSILARRSTPAYGHPLKGGASEGFLASNSHAWVFQITVQALAVVEPSHLTLLFKPDDTVVMDV